MYVGPMGAQQGIIMKSRFFTTVLSVAALQLCLAGAAQAQATLPDFSGRDAWAGNYRTRIVEGLRKGPNFAGHYSLIEIGMHNLPVRLPRGCAERPGVLLPLWRRRAV